MNVKNEHNDFSHNRSGQSGRRKNQAVSQRLWNALLSAMLFLLCFSIFFACGIDDNDDDNTNPFDAPQFYRANIVEIIAAGDYGENSGTGIILNGDDNGIIIASNLHVAGKHGELISVRFYSEDNYINTQTISNESVIEMLSFDETTDLCIFKVDYMPQASYNNLTKQILGYDITPLIDNVTIEKGQDVYSYGNVLGEGIELLEGKVAELSQKVTTQLGEINLIKTSIKITDGCSGGALFDKQGRLLGLTAFDGGNYGANFSFSVPSSDIYTLYQDAISKIATN